MSASPSPSPSPWDGWQPAVCWPDCFCEAPRAAWIRQPADTWSNLAYVAVGLLILWQARAQSGRSERLGDDPRTSAFYGALCVALGAGSFFFHASLTYWGEWLDVLAMYVVVGYLGLYGLRRSGLLTVSVGAGLAALTGASVLVLSAPALTLLRLPLMIAIVLTLAASEGRRLASRERPMHAALFAAALAQFVLALALWILDRRKLACAPDSLLQGHAFWHCLCAGALGTLYLYYRSERTSPAPHATEAEISVT